MSTCLIWAKSPDPMVNPYISTQSPTYIMGTCLAWTKPLAPLVLIVVFIVLMKLNKKVLTIQSHFSRRFIKFYELVWKTIQISIKSRLGNFKHVSITCRSKIFQKGFFSKYSNFRLIFLFPQKNGKFLRFYGFSVLRISLFQFTLS